MDLPQRPAAPRTAAARTNDMSLCTGGMGGSQLRLSGSIKKELEKFLRHALHVYHCSLYSPLGSRYPQYLRLHELTTKKLDTLGRDYVVTYHHVVDK